MKVCYVEYKSPRWQMLSDLGWRTWVVYFNGIAEMRRAFL